MTGAQIYWVLPEAEHARMRVHDLIVRHTKLPAWNLVLEPFVGLEAETVLSESELS
jgi:hypothetical protein